MDEVDLAAKLTTLMEITGLTNELAKDLLTTCDQDVEKAVNLHLENVKNEAEEAARGGGSCGGRGGGGSGIGGGPSDDDYDDDDDDDDDDDVVLVEAVPERMPTSESGEYVRPPIPRRRETLQTPDDDNFAATLRRTSRRPSMAMCPMRDFSLEGDLQEEDFAAENETTEYGGRRASQRSSMKRKRLEYLFRAPIDIMFVGTFLEARDYAQAKHRWLIVNLQDPKEFQSQLLNRDIWSDRTIKRIIKKDLIFYQMHVDTPDGLRFKTFYNCRRLPYVCIVDPQTGEEKFHFSEHLKPSEVKAHLVQFLKENIFAPRGLPERIPDVFLAPTYPCLAKDMPSTSKGIGASTSTARPMKLAKRRPSCTVTSAGSSSTKTYIEEKAEEKFTAIMEEETQDKFEEETEKKYEVKELKPTADLIPESTEGGDDDATPAKKPKTEDEDEDIADNDDEDVADNSADNASGQSSGYELFLGNLDDPKTKIQLRMPSDIRKVLEWPNSAKLRALPLYVKEKYPKANYKIIIGHSRENLMDLNLDMTLADANLHPSAVLYLQEDVPAAAAAAAAVAKEE